jgi:FixJ family two-component response regulator
MAPAAPHGTEPLRILLVDDEDEVRDALPLLLRRQGHVVAVAASGRAALDHLANGLTVDLLLIGLVTGWSDVRGLPSERAAVDFILAKPLDRRALAEAIARVARRRGVAA